MIKQILTISLVLLFPAALLTAQEDNRVLFEVEGEPVTVSEFEYIYTKTNGKQATFSRPSLEEYLDLYVKFKLKVQKARDMKLDTVPSLQRELAGYRRQLSNSYLVDKRVTRVLAKELYDRMQRDVNISHILIATQPGMPNDTAASWERAMRVKDRLQKGEDFATVARELSEDKTTAQEGGRIGFVTAMFPDGFYDLESLAYNLEKGEWGGPVRTKAGYHFVRLNEERPARGEMDVSHILIREGDKRSSEEAKALTDSLYQLLVDGASTFEDVAKLHSEDRMTSRRGGYLGPFGINRYELAFEDAAFALEEDGAFTEPVHTSLGWHIIRRNRKKETLPFAQSLPSLQNKLMRDSRHREAEDAMVQQIKDEAGYKLDEEVLQIFLDSIDAGVFLTHRWKIPKFEEPYATLFSLSKGYKYPLLDFAQHCKRSTRLRLRGTRSTAEEVAMEIFEDFVREKVLKYEEKQLERKYPEFKALMREYEEGILLFEASKQMVWDRASQDTVGLKKFYERNKQKYRWNQRARVTEYTLVSDAAPQINDIREYAMKKLMDKVLDKFNTEDKKIIFAQSADYEKGKESKLIGTPFELGAVSEAKGNSRSRNITFFKIEAILPETTKTLEEARGFVVADYQDYLEKNWIKELERAYDVKVNEEVFESLIKQ